MEGRLQEEREASVKRAPRMVDAVLCDIGNSFYHFYHAGRIWKNKHSQSLDLPEGTGLYFISVNPKATKRLLQQVPGAVDLGERFRLDTIYEGLGIDRIAACTAIEDGVVVDAGSAITVDVMQNGVHLGGYILPGIATLLKSYKTISPVLAHNINAGIKLDTFPQSTRDAISYGIMKSVLMMIQETSKSKAIYFTGGDGKFLSRYFEHALYDNSLIFKGMLKVLKGG